jgi:predicted membrane protein
VLTDEQHVNKLSNEYKSISKVNDYEIIENIVRFSVNFQDVFVKSDLTAKTKIHEHWFMRMPIYATCITIIYGVNVYDTNRSDYTKIIFMTIAYILSLYLVAIRFHQSVSAETKKFSSELYSKEKNNLFANLINKLKQSDA